MRLLKGKEAKARSTRGGVWAPAWRPLRKWEGSGGSRRAATPGLVFANPEFEMPVEQPGSGVETTGAEWAWVRGDRPGLRAPQFRPCSGTRTGASLHAPRPPPPSTAASETRLAVLLRRAQRARCRAVAVTPRGQPRALPGSSALRDDRGAVTAPGRGLRRARRCPRPPAVTVGDVFAGTLLSRGGPRRDTPRRAPCCTGWGGRGNAGAGGCARPPDPWWGSACPLTRPRPEQPADSSSEVSSLARGAVCKVAGPARVSVGR